MGQALETAEWLAELRGRQTKIFSTIMFAEPGWDIMLTLFIHEERHASSIQIKDLPELTGQNSAVLARWISLFLLNDYLVLDADNRYVSLTVEAVEKMRSVLL